MTDDTVVTDIILDRLESPPRLVGDPSADVSALGQYIQRLYENLILNKGVLQAVDQPTGSFNSSDGSVEAFPVGAVFIAVVDTDPADLLGYGTWSRIGKGRALVGVDEDDPDFDTVLEESGSKTEAAAGTVDAPVFTGDAMGTHSHGAGTLAVSAHVTHTQTAANGADFEAVKTIDDHTVSGSTAAVSAGTPSGSVSAPNFTGIATSVVQPSLAVYIWQRTA